MADSAAMPFQFPSKIISALLPVIIIIVLYILVSLVIGRSRKRLLQRAKTVEQKKRVKSLAKGMKIFFLALFIFFGISFMSDSLGSFGIGVGFFSAALGWALQRPITGMAAWVMVVVKRPFKIGDRVIIGNIKGDIVSISLTHICINEVGGTAGGEEKSGRIILIPNSNLFEQNIINYTNSVSESDIVIDQVTVAVTFTSNIEKAVNLMKEAAMKHTKPYAEISKRSPFVRTYIQSSGMNIHVKYPTAAKKLQETQSLVSREVYESFRKELDIKFAFSHHQVMVQQSTTEKKD
jgi:small-conductance mechanosensitive channel